MAEKSYLSCIDGVLDLEHAEVLTQAVQHLVISNFAKSIGGTITFYTGEDRLTRSSQSLMRSTLLKKPPVDGVIFYRLKQFFYGKDFDFGFLQEVLDQGYEVHFAREALSIRNRADLEEEFSNLYCYQTVGRGLSGALSAALGL